MARPELLADSQRVFISQLKLDADEKDVKLTASNVIQALTEHLIEKERELHQDDPYEFIHKRVEDEQLSPSAIRKYLTEVNSRLNNHEFDQPWHLALMRNPKYAIHPEAIPYVISVRRFQRLKRLPDEVTIRQAWWIANLYAVVTEVEDLYYNSMFYAMHENICNIAHVPFDTANPDIMLPDSEKVKETFVELLLNGGE